MYLQDRGLTGRTRRSGLATAPYSEKYVRNWFRHEDEEGRAYQTRSRKGKIIRQYLDESLGMPLSTVWSDIMQLSSRCGWFPSTDREETGYPTQKPLALLRRIVCASSNPGDTVLDPFCGCATACIAAEFEGREWAGIDISPKAAELVAQRMRDEVGMFYDGAHRTDIPLRTDLGKLPPYQSHKKALYGEQAGNCAGCGTHFEVHHFDVDHIISTGKGGTDHVSNLQLLCGHCNRVKGDRGMEYLRAKLAL